MKLYTFVVHYLQMATIFLHAHLQVVYYNCVKFHKNSISRLVGVALTRYMNYQQKVFRSEFNLDIFFTCWSHFLAHLAIDHVSFCHG
jgi:hypothetical protein